MESSSSPGCSGPAPCRRPRRPCARSSDGCSSAPGVPCTQWGGQIPGGSIPSHFAGIHLDAGERAVVGRMPVAGRHHEVEPVRDRVQRRADLVAALHGQRPAGREVVLEVDDQQRVHAPYIRNAVPDSNDYATPPGRAAARPGRDRHDERARVSEGGGARSPSTRRAAGCTPCSRSAPPTCAATRARSRSRAGAWTTARSCATPRSARPRRRSAWRASRCRSSARSRPPARS